MKRTLLFFLIFLPILASAETVEIGGVYYILEDENKTAKVTSMPLGYYSDDIIIPYKEDAMEDHFILHYDIEICNLNN